MSDSYVCSKAKIKCSCGDKISTLTVYPDRTIWLTGEPQANISDHISMRNIAPFGRCHTTAYPATGAATAAAHGKLTPMPCVPNTPFPWMGGKNDVILQGQPALLKTSQCKCVYGGTITLVQDGQVPGTYSELQEYQQSTQEELDEEADVTLSAEELLDVVQMALDAAGLVPGFGAIPDILNACISACRGDWTNAGLCLFAAVPGIGDAAGAAKIMKNGAKMAKKSKKFKNASSLSKEGNTAVKQINSQNLPQGHAGFDELAARREMKQAKAQKEQMIERGIAEGKVTKFERSTETVVKKEATTGRPIELNQPTSITRTEVTKASSINPYEKVTPITPCKSTGSATSYGAGNRDWNMGKGGKDISHKNESLFEFKEQIPEKKVVNIDDVRKPKRYEEVKPKIDKGEKPPKMGI